MLIDLCFVREYHELQTLLQLNVVSRTMHRCDKDSVLRDYYSKREESSIEGYEEQINVNS